MMALPVLRSDGTETTRPAGTSPKNRRFVAKRERTGAAVLENLARPWGAPEAFHIRDSSRTLEDSSTVLQRPGVEEEEETWPSERPGELLLLGQSLDDVQGVVVGETTYSRAPGEKKPLEVRMPVGMHGWGLHLDSQQGPVTV
jgi:hypothetical protein